MRRGTLGFTVLQYGTIFKQYFGILIYCVVLQYHRAPRYVVFQPFGWWYSVKEDPSRYFGTGYLPFPV